VFIKATEGKDYQDAYFQANWRGTKEHGLLRGAYHFYAEHNSGAEQANNYISIVPKEAGMPATRAGPGSIRQGTTR